MGGSSSRIWSDICELESDSVRAQMIRRVMQSSDHVMAAQQVGLYGGITGWLSAYSMGLQTPFPWQKRPSDPRMSMYTTPVAAASAPASPPPPTSSALTVTPAARALDEFHEALEVLGIREDEGLTVDLIKAAYKRRTLRVHPDKPGGSKEAFDELQKAYLYVVKILKRINPEVSAAEKERQTAPVTMERATAARADLADVAPVQLSAKKLDMSMFNKLFEENRMPDQHRDGGYGDWLKSQGGDDSVASDPRLKGKFNNNTFETVFRERALKQTAGTAIIKRAEPDALLPTYGTELGGQVDNFTAAFGADVQFTDLKEAYTTGSTVYHEVADVSVKERSARSIKEAQRIRQEEMARVDPDEKARIAAAAAALEERERQRKLRLAQQDTASESWAEQMRKRLFVMNG
jgi:curved DNA-binding protein CbpA